MAMPNLTMTKGGLALLAQAQLGEGITFTRWLLGTGGPGTGAEDGDQTALASPRLALPIAAVERGDSRCTVTGHFTNQEQEPFLWRETGLFARAGEGAEVLYAYGSDPTGEPIPDGTQVLREIELGAQLVVGAAQVTALVEDGLVYLLQRQLGRPQGVAPLDEGGKVPRDHLPVLQTLGAKPLVTYNGGEP